MLAMKASPCAKRARIIISLRPMRRKNYSISLTPEQSDAMQVMLRKRLLQNASQLFAYLLAEAMQELKDFRANSIKNNNRKNN